MNNSLLGQKQILAQIMHNVPGSDKVFKILKSEEFTNQYCRKLFDLLAAIKTGGETPTYAATLKHGTELDFIRGGPDLKKLEEVAGTEITCDVTDLVAALKADNEVNSLHHPLPGELKAMPLPLEAFPLCFQNYIREAAESLVCPPDFIALPLLVTAGSVIGRTRRIALKTDWTEFPSLYAALVGQPGDRKTPALAKATQPINRLAKKLHNEYVIECETFELASEDYEIKLGKWKKNNTTLDKPEKPNPPKCMRLYAVDATTEAVSNILQDNPRGLCIIRDELAAWAKSQNQYRQGKGADREFWLSCWAGAPAHVDRKGSEPIILFAPFLSVVGGIQPDIIEELRDGKNRSDGFLDRILFVYPEQVAPRWSDKTINESSILAVNQCFNKLLDLDFKEDGEPRTIALDSAARELFINWLGGHYKESESEIFPYVLRGPWSKMPGQLARVTLIIHLCRYVMGEIENILIDDTSMANGITLIKYFKSHARKVYNALELTSQEKKIIQIHAWIKKTGREEITVRDIQMNHVAGLKTASEIRELLNVAADGGYGDWENKYKNFIFS